MENANHSTHSASTAADAQVFGCSCNFGVDPLLLELFLELNSEGRCHTDYNGFRGHLAIERLDSLGELLCKVSGDLNDAQFACVRVA